MDFSEGTALEIVERLCAAYGVTTQKALAESIGIPAANVSNWVQRDSVPGSAFVKCALDTGSDLYWLTTGKLANARIVGAELSESGAALFEKVMANGGKQVLRRILDAYGFKTQKQLCDQLNISSGTVSTWIRREYFPGDVVVTCALQTGVSLRWLALGEGDYVSRSIETKNSIKLQKYSFSRGNIISDGEVEIDHFLLRGIQAFDNLKYIYSSDVDWIVDFNKTTIPNGEYFIKLDNIFDIYNVFRMPEKKLKLMKDQTEIVCQESDIDDIGEIVIKIKNCI